MTHSSSGSILTSPNRKIDCCAPMRLRGEIFAEIVFDEDLNVSNFFVMDPRYAAFEKRIDDIYRW